MWLIGDVGGTSARFAMVTQADGPRVWKHDARYESTRYEDLESMIEAYREQHQASFEGICLGVAGPVREGRVDLTNLGWSLDVRLMRERLGVERIVLLNDLQAMAYAIPVLEAFEREVIQEGKPQDDGVIGLVAAGTGLGESALWWDGHRYHAMASEGGHCDFAPVDDEQVGLLRFVMREHAHVSYERVCSGGLGMAYLYRYLREVRGFEGHEEIDKAVARNGRDVARLIAEEAGKPGLSGEFCKDVMRLFSRILASELGNLALKLLPTGGLYLGGGLAVGARDLFREPAFLAAFRSKGRYARTMEDFSISVITHPEPGLLGVANYALNLG
ncbi:MAG: glucokinase [Myxococcales bacterium]|nr:glucokinase [Myxococcales bacterium]